VTMHSFRA